MNPLSRFASSPQGDDGLCCAAALAGRPAFGPRRFHRLWEPVSAMDN
jgi:hypothetical protein